LLPPAPATLKQHTGAGPQAIPHLVSDTCPATREVIFGSDRAAGPGTGVPLLPATEAAMRITQDTRDLWAAHYRDCGTELTDLDLDRARFILATHSGHGGRCLPYLAAMAFSLGSKG
jgi:hypothetical protein